jgi:hypothetical protein
MSNIIAATIAILMAMVYMIHYAYRLHDIALWVIIGVNIGFLLYDYYNTITKGEDHI